MSKNNNLEICCGWIPPFSDISPPFSSNFLPRLATLSPHRTPMWTPKSSRFPHAQLGVFADQAVIFRAQAREVALERRVAEGAERHGSGVFLVPHRMLKKKAKRKTPMETLKSSKTWKTVMRYAKSSDSTTWLVADYFFQLREKLEPDIGPTDWVGLGCFQSISKQETWNHHPRIEKSKIFETAKVVSTQAGMEQGDSCPILSLPPWPRVQSPLPYHSTNPKLDGVKLRRHRTRRKKTPMLVYLKELDILLNDFLWMAHQPETMMTNAGHLQNLQTLKLGTGASENMFFCIFICIYIIIYILYTMISCTVYLYDLYI